MKKIVFIMLAFAVAFSACKKDKGDVSKVVPVAGMEVNGEKFISIRVGDPMPTDEGARVIGDVATDGNNDVMAIENTVDPSKAGMYYMLYSTKTQNGYEVGAARYVAVTDYDDNVDLSGTYTRKSNGIEVPVERKARGLYENGDMGGAGLTDVIYFAVINETTIAVGPQYSESLHAIIETESEGLHIAPPGKTAFQYAFTDAPGYGPAIRVFEKNE